MPDIRIHRDHQLGLEKAREIAWQWAEEVEQKFDMSCTVVEGDFSDTVSFKRTGVSGELIVAADHFDLHAKLGFLLGAFAKTIETEILKNLDGLLGQAAGKAAAKSASKAAAKSAATKAAPGKAATARKKTSH
jgi:putative polyhydroxyalkanoate system protein